MAINWGLWDKLLDKINIASHKVSIGKKYIHLLKDVAYFIIDLPIRINGEKLNIVPGDKILIQLNSPKSFQEELLGLLKSLYPENIFIIIPTSANFKFIEKTESDKYHLVLVGNIPQNDFKKIKDILETDKTKCLKVSSHIEIFRLDEHRMKDYGWININRLKGIEKLIDL